MFIEVSGCRVYFEEAGKGEPLLLLHGWGVSSETLKPLFYHLAKRRHVRVIDFPGFGLSNAPPSGGGEVWGTSEYAEMLHSILDSWGWKGADVLAHSFGCRVVIRLIAGRKGYFKRLLLTGAPGIRLKGSVPLYKKILSLAGKMFASFGPPGRWVRGRIYAKIGSADYIAAGEMRGILVKVVNEDLSPLLAEVENETLLVWGEADTATPLEIGKKMEALMPNATLNVIPGAGHYSFAEKPETFFSIADRFFERDNR